MLKVVTRPVRRKLCSVELAGRHQRAMRLELRRERLHIGLEPVANFVGLGDLQVALRREADGAEADPFDEAMMAAVYGVAEAMKAEADALAKMETRLGRMARKS